MLLTPLSEADVMDYESRVEQAVSSVFDADGKYLHGEFLKRLDVPRRGWILRGIHPRFAETTREHTGSLDDAANAVSGNETAGVSYAILNNMFRGHDDVDAFHDDIAYGDNVSKKLKLKIERFAMETFYSKLPGATGHRKMADYFAFENREMWGGELAFWLDKQDAATHAKHLQNNFSDLTNLLKSDENAVAHLFERQGVGTFDAAMRGLYNELDEFYVDNVTNIFPGTQMAKIAEKVFEYEGEDVKTHYLNLLSSHPLK